MEASQTLKKNSDFRRLYAKGKSAVTPQVVVYCRRTGRGYDRLGITVTAKLGTAVHRNRVRRRLREIYRLNLPRLKKGFDIVIVARVRSRRAEYRQLESAYLSACSKLGLLAEERRGEK